MFHSSFVGYSSLFTKMSVLCKAFPALCNLFGQMNMIFVHSLLNTKYKI